MFTGLIADMGRIEAVESGAEGARLRISTPLAAELAEGDSIAVNGVCLTATAIAGGAFAADAMNQTLELTSLGGLGSGDAVNLELALRASDRLGGHIVQGHVDGAGTVAAVIEDGFARRIKMTAPDQLMPLVVEHGSIAVDGVSLTVSALDADGFAVSLIPETLSRTTLGSLTEGDRVNLECDIVARHVQRLLGPLRESTGEK